MTYTPYHYRSAQYHNHNSLWDANYRMLQVLIILLTGGILQSLMGGMGDMDMGAPPSRLPPAVSAPAAVDEDLD